MAVSYTHLDVYKRQGIDMKPDDVSLRCNLVTLSEDDKPYEEKTIEDYCADDISTEGMGFLMFQSNYSYFSERLTLYYQPIWLLFSLSIRPRLPPSTDRLPSA